MQIDLVNTVFFHAVFRRSANALASCAVNPYTDNCGLAPMLVGNS
jgi:hypothetical protein